MNNFKKRIIAFAALCCVALTATVGCSSKNSSSKSSGGDQQTTIDDAIQYETNDDGAQIKAPLQVITPNDDGKVSVADGVDFNAPDVIDDGSGSGNSVQPVTEYVAATDSNNEPVTEIVTVTEAGGEPVTEEGGSVVTSAVTVTTAVTVTEENGEPVTEVVTNDYKSNTKSRFLYWLDISKDADFKFEGQFIKLYFKINENAPERDYPITVTSDLANCQGQSLNKNTKRINGTIRVGGDIEAQDVSGESGLVVYADNLSAKPGDTVEYYLNIKNNPGLVASILWVSFDSNAMEFIDCEPAGDFADIAGGVSSGAKN